MGMFSSKQRFALALALTILFSTSAKAQDEPQEEPQEEPGETEDKTYYFRSVRFDPGPGVVLQRADKTQRPDLYPAVLRVSIREAGVSPGFIFMAPYQ